MDSVLRAAAIYLALMVLFKIAGRRSLSDLTSFDLVLLMIIGEATQQALLGEDFSWINAVLVIATLIALDVGFSLAKLGSTRLARVLEGNTTLVVEHGRFLPQRMRHARLTEEDVMESARSSQGLEQVSQIKYAMVERKGKISIITYE
ncbi:MAG TPA: YetF domain-containing protein [Pseudomonas sp.]|nr:YetF domain-containing protein [Pseudomonas sp.]